MLRYGIVPMRKKVLQAYIIGSQAKGTANCESDLDIAIIIEAMKTKSALRFTEEYHSKFKSEDFTPKWYGKKIDSQFFYTGDKLLLGYPKIAIRK